MNLKRLSNLIIVLLITFFFLGSFISVYSEEVEEELFLGQHILAPDISRLVFVDAQEKEIEPPSVNFGSIKVSSEPQTISAKLGTDSKKLRMQNFTSQNEIHVSVAPKVEIGFEEDAHWKHTEEEVSYSVYGSEEEGKMVVNPHNIFIDKTDGCGEMNKGLKKAFEKADPGPSGQGFEGVESIDLFSTLDGEYCQADIKNIEFEQTIPPHQLKGVYEIEMVLTLVTAGS